MARRPKKNSAVSAPTLTSGASLDLSWDLSGLESSRFRLPIRPGSPFAIRSEEEYATFLLAWEAYRVMELLDRQAMELVEQYSKFRSREQFIEALRVRYFDDLAPWLAKVQPEIGIRLVALFNLLHELKVSLAHTDAMPFTVKGRIDDTLTSFREAWESTRDLLEKRHGWVLRRIGEQ